jgi:hypothetical protein
VETGQIPVASSAIRELTGQVALEVLMLVVVAIVVPVVPVAVRMVVVGDLAAIAIPVTLKVSLSIMMRLNPVSATVGRARIVSVMPLIVVTHRVPVASNPNVTGSGAPWLDPNYSWPGWWADSDADGKLSEDGSNSQQHQHNQFRFHDTTPSLSISWYTAR